MLAHAQALRRSTIEEDSQVEDLDVVVANLQCQFAEAAFAAPDANGVAIDAETNELLAQQLPLFTAAIRTAATIVTGWPAIVSGARTAITIASLRRRNIDGQREHIGACFASARSPAPP